MGRDSPSAPAFVCHPAFPSFRFISGTSTSSPPPCDVTRFRYRCGRRTSANRPCMSADAIASPSFLDSQIPATLNKNEDVSILWFRNDLRLRDNEALNLANTASIMMPMYIFDEAQYGADNLSPHGFERTGAFRADFIRQAVDDVRKLLVSRGSDMVVNWGDPLERLRKAIEKLAKALVSENQARERYKYRRIVLVGHKETTHEEMEMEKEIERVVEQAVAESGLEFDVFWIWGSTLHHFNDLPFNPVDSNTFPHSVPEYVKWIESEDGPEVRDEFEAAEKLTPFPFALMIKNEVPILGEDLDVSGLADPNDYPFPDHRAVMPFHGGPTAAGDRIQDYVWEREGTCVYKESRDSSGTIDFSTKFSPWLAIGCLSPRTVYWEMKKFEMQTDDDKAPESTACLLCELLARDYFRFLSINVGTRLFALNGYGTATGREEEQVRDNDNGIIISEEHGIRLQKWMDGDTGVPFIDANMRELKYTGYMSNRGRRNVASFLLNELEYPDWRAGAEYFESKLIDHDVASNWGNWGAIAGVTREGAQDSKYKLNPVEESFQYDSEGWFIKGWCPELYWVDPPHVHQPFTMTEKERYDTRCTNEDHKDYPAQAIVPVAQVEATAQVEKKCDTPFPPIPDFEDFVFQVACESRAVPVGANPEQDQ